ncbi:uncharacterized protein LOC119305748 [Triticum dicoccoides]|uniref:uncharacterized protein LOC119305748 n=1 Tax=Triticum dicoccoides TaxID=85692 RepID=UPI00188E7845|nr:uncharacterized protein LOC119305748 [Triticum dicoccoides]
MHRNARTIAQPTRALDPKRIEALPPARSRVELLCAHAAPGLERPRSPAVSGTAPEPAQPPEPPRASLTSTSSLPRFPVRLRRSTNDQLEHHDRRLSLSLLFSPSLQALSFSHDGLSVLFFTGTDAIDTRALPRVHHRCRFASDPAGDHRISPPPPWTTHPQTSSAPPCHSLALSSRLSPSPCRCSALCRAEDEHLDPYLAWPLARALTSSSAWIAPSFAAEPAQQPIWPSQRPPHRPGLGPCVAS